jgi:hypothetical protein
MHRLRVYGGLVCAAALSILSGCGGAGGVVVQGTVTVNGQPLKSGAISFNPISGQGAAAGAEITNGTYGVRAQGLLPGEYRVAINAFRGTGKKTWDGMGDANVPASQKRYVGELEQYIPAKYNDQTELTATIAAGKINHLKFDLQITAGRTPK